MQCIRLNKLEKIILKCTKNRMSPKKKIYLVDGYNFIYRLFYAIPQFSLKDWTPINTVFGMAKIIIWLFKEDKPDYLVFILDYKWKKIRETIYPEYKWTRDRMPTDLKTQEDLIMWLLETFGIKTVQEEWYEADDVIGTLALKLKQDSNNEIFILSWDKDLYQFIDNNVCIYDTMKRKIFHEKESFEKFWVNVEYIADYLSICWDSSDNIPGIPWFWPKKAQELINKYWSLENIYASIEEITWKAREILENNKDIAFLSKKLASIYSALELKLFDIKEHNFKDINLYNEKIIELFKKYEFKSLIPTQHQDAIKNFNTLWLKVNKIKTENELNSLFELIKSNDKISISTIWNNVFELDILNIFIWWKNVYSINTNELDITEFLQNIFTLEIEIIWFELKNDLKKIKWYLNKFEISNSPKNELQWSLF